MIVECESCRTRFRLDDAKVPATGAKVRCSRCKTAFIVHRKTASRDEAIEEVVAEATNPGATRSPDVTQDLFDVSASRATTGAVAPSAGADEEKWEFDDDARPARQQAPPSATNEAPRGEKARAPALDEEDLDSLGSPSEWNFLGAGRASAVAPHGSQEPAKPEPRAEPAPAPEKKRKPRSARAAEPRDPEPSVDVSIAHAVDDAPAERPATAVRDRLHEATTRVISGAAWIAASALCLVGLGLALTPRAQLEAAASAPMNATFDGATHPIEVHTLESAVAGPLVVVRGQLPERALRSAGEQVRASWVDVNGARLESRSALASPPREPRALRESSLERLQASHGALSGGAFEVVFDALPSGAAGISLKREAVPLPVAAAAPAPPEDATTSSRLSLPLSSE